MDAFYEGLRTNRSYLPAVEGLTKGERRLLERREAQRQKLIHKLALLDDDTAGEIYTERTKTNLLR